MKFEENRKITSTEQNALLLKNFQRRKYKDAVEGECACFRERTRRRSSETLSRRLQISVQSRKFRRREQPEPPLPQKQKAAIS